MHAVGLTRLLALLAVAAAVAGLGAAVALSRRGRRDETVDLRSLAVALVVAGTFGGGAGILVILAAGGGPFPVLFTGVHIAYLAVTVTVPLLGAGLLILGREGSTRWTRAAAVAFLVPAPVGAYATHVEPNWLRVDHVAVAVAAERAGDDPIRIAVLADLQTSGIGDHEREAIDRILAAEPDIVLLPGDLFQGSEDQLDATWDDLRRELGRLQAPGGVYYVRGDADGGDLPDRLLTGSDVTIVDDAVVEATVGDRRIRIGGTRLAYRSRAADRVRADLEATPDDGALTVLVSHRPDTALLLAERSRVDLTVAGHTHGGQVVIPGFGPPVTFSAVPRSVARGGLHRVNGNQIYVSPGVGVERDRAPQVRLFSRPAVALLTVADVP